MLSGLYADFKFMNWWFRFLMSRTGDVKYGDYEYATIGSVEQLLMISADPRIFGVCCNVWPDPN